MQKNLKIATFIAVIFVVFVFGIKYFSTTVKTIMSYPNFNSNKQDYSLDNISQHEEDNNSQEEQQDNTVTEKNNILEEFNYNTPITEQDPKAQKRDITKKLNYSNYEDRIRMESPAYLDANGLYVALMQAIDDNDIKRAKSLIARGARLNSPDGNTSYAPIFWALNNGNVEMIDLLIQKGVKVNTPDDKGSFPVHWIVETASNRPSVYKMKEIFDLFFDAHPEEINRQDTVFKQTPIMMAVNLNNKKAFAYLLDRGANLNITDGSERNIVELSVANACHACVSLVESKEKENQITPLLNFASTFTAPDPIWLPYSTAKKTTKKKKQTRNPNEVVISGDSLAIPVYKEMPQILPLKKEEGPNMVITERY